MSSKKVCHFDENLLQSIRSKRMTSTLSHPALTQYDCTMFEEFIIFGNPLDPAQLNSTGGGSSSRGGDYNPRIILKFPSTGIQRTPQEYEQICQFCFPNGLKYATSSKSRGFIQSAFPFFLNNSSQTIYGFCVVFIPPKSHIPFFASKFSTTFPFAFCILSKAKLISPMAEFVTFLANYSCAKERAYELPGYHSLTPTSHGTCPEPLRLSEEFPQIAILEGIKIPKFFHTLLDYYYSIDCFNVPPIKLSKNFTLQWPSPQSEDQCLAYPTLPCLLTHLSTVNIVKLYTALLLDYHILIYSKYPERYSNCVIAASMLVKPFMSITTIMPVLPLSFNEVLGTPTPFIYGMGQKFDVDVIVDVDKNEIISQELPVLPGTEDIARKLNLVIEAASTGETSPLVLSTAMSKLDPPKYNASPFLVDSILSIFTNHLPPRLSSELQPFFVTDKSEENPVTVLNTDLFLSSCKSIERPFYESFSHTLAFEEFLNKVTENYQRMQEERHEGRLFFSDCSL
ncbi:uDENN domain containing protein [Trichomonas vaginalis G3]|uniref:UDENN domain containing protein n=2 Tax=Trichomonas vaginalis (strain ATCC PRA-98 / G3) TaxID=412133 RepID=A2E7C4_TRIV3|nr:DENN domain-containing family [Trichomonas vaginalis G3]EAY11417.1 uDENN domain containing protein [Trichomonas vaginalis G3]KAI5498624.1 DENN domain-containing family [Trichomonas vaginalis G3]|eukprot:XP_001323640.1 uDENN domain containing protein [Trichomonas vaginalis G3]